MKKNILIAIIVCIFLTVFGGTAGAVGASSLTDIKGHWAEASIRTAVSRGIVSGFPNGTFKPDASITRAEIASILSRLTKQSTTTNSTAFMDVNKHWAKDQIRKLVALGFIKTSDYPNGFAPDKAITRYELMKWIGDGLATSDNSFKQALEDTKDTFLPTPESFKGTIKANQIPYIAVVKGTGIIEGFEDGSFKPNQSLTRAEATIILLKYGSVEGTIAEKYSALNELREVGKTGTNLLSATDFEYIEGSKSIFEKKLSLPSADIVAHRLIFVDTRGKEDKGLYAPFFVGKEKQPFQNGKYTVYFEFTITAKVDNIDVFNLENEFDINSNFLRFTRINGRVSEKIGAPVIPGDSPEKFLKKGVSRRVWSYTTVSKDSTGRTYTLNDGTFFGFY